MFVEYQGQITFSPWWETEERKRGRERERECGKEREGERERLCVSLINMIR